jgi:hypothetical protein
MRKQTKLAVALTASALFVVGAMTSFAAGWAEEGGQWFYYNNSGDYVTDTWKKSGADYFYLGDDGAMVTNALIDDNGQYYYVDANGAMVKNRWVQIEADDSEEQDVDYRWYRFGATGKALKAGSGAGIAKKTVDGKKYGFDEEGKMLFGFVSDSGEILTDNDPALECMYYFGSNEDGAMTTGWLNYTDGFDNEDYDKDSYWFYFNTSTGKKYQSTDANKLLEKTIQGKKYAFDENGIMQSKWGTTTDSSGASATKYYGSADQGWVNKKGWIWAIPSKDMNAQDNDEDKYRWFYATSGGDIATNCTKKINSKWYVFDSVGRMKAGLIELDSESVSGAHFVKKIDQDETDGKDILEMNMTAGHGLYFFGAEATDGAMKTGTSVKIDMADDTWTFGFAKNGKGYDKVEKNKLYINGCVASATDMRYDLAKGSDGNYYVVGVSGTVVKANKTVKDADGNFWAVKTYPDTTGNDTFFVSGDNDDASLIAKALAAGKTTYTKNSKTNTITPAMYTLANAYTKGLNPKK